MAASSSKISKIVSNFILIEFTICCDVRGVSSTKYGKRRIQLVCNWCENGGYGLDHYCSYHEERIPEVNHAGKKTEGKECS